MREGGRAATIVELDRNFEDAIDRNLTLHGVLARPGAETIAFRRSCTRAPYAR